MLTKIVTDERAWRGDSLRAESWIVPIPQTCLEVAAAICALLFAAATLAYHAIEAPGRQWVRRMRWAIPSLPTG